MKKRHDDDQTLINKSAFLVDIGLDMIASQCLGDLETFINRAVGRILLDLAQIDGLRLVDANSPKSEIDTTLRAILVLQAVVDNAIDEFWHGDECIRAKKLLNLDHDHDHDRRKDFRTRMPPVPQHVIDEVKKRRVEDMRWIRNRWESQA